MDDLDDNLATISQTQTGLSSMIPGTYPPEWLSDNETDSCMACDNLFTLIKRRHHCRSCGKIFCSDCCRQKAKLQYLDNKEARVCSSCFHSIECAQSDVQTRTSAPTSARTSGESSQDSRVHGVLKTANSSRSGNLAEPNTASSTPFDHQSNKHVMFSDGIRPGTDLSESHPYRMSPSSSTNGQSSPSIPNLSRQNKSLTSPTSSNKSRCSKLNDSANNNITVCDELGYLPPIVIETTSDVPSNEVPSSSSSIISLITSQFLGSPDKEESSLHSSMESRTCPLNAVMKFEEISNLVGTAGIITFLLLKGFYLKVKVVRPHDEINKLDHPDNTKPINDQSLDDRAPEIDFVREFWCFASDGLSKYGQNEVVLVLDKDEGDSCIPRDVFKIYLTLHELALRRQTIENLGNLLFQDGLFESRNTAGLLFVRHLDCHNIANLIQPANPFLFALVLQRWEVPWSKVFPVRLLLRLGHKLGHYPYPLVSYKVREPVYYEVGHTIISILGDFRNFRYSITHVDGLRVMIVKSEKKVVVQLCQSSYQQFNKVLDRSSNEHVLAWSAFPFLDADGHLVSVQNEDGQYETLEFFRSKQQAIPSITVTGIQSVIGASFVVFSGALKVNQSGQPAKISIVEDGLLIQLQSCALSALKEAIHYMKHFDINCGKCYKLKSLHTSHMRLILY